MSVEKELINCGLYGERLSNGEIAWHSDAIPGLMQLALEHRWIVLGGDVLTLSKEYTYDNWFYEPHHQCSLLQNVQESIQSCEEFINKYIAANGPNYIFVVVFSDSFLDGK